MSCSHLRNRRVQRLKIKASSHFQIAEIRKSDIEVPSFAFTRSETPITVTLSSVGLKDRELEAFLKQDGSVLQRRTVKMVGRVGQLKFNLMPTTLGQQVFEVSLPVPEGDAVPENNRRDITASIQINSPPIPQVVATCWPSWPYPSGTIQWRYSFS